MKEITKHYTNGEVTIVWKNALCIHSTKCWKGLNAVFNPNEKPWIKPEAAPTSDIIEQVKKCPSGALTYLMNIESTETPAVEAQNSIICEPSPNGPLLVHGDIIVKDAEGNEIKKSKTTAFCRCGQSSNKPYCDGTHRKVDFKG